MATSSIVKDFKVIDKENFEKLLIESEQIPKRDVKVNDNSSIKRGSELLKHFSFPSII